MPKIPESLRPFKARAEKLYAKGAVAQVEFAGPTYQVQVVDSKDPDGLWTFLQLTPAGSLRDCFCSCPASPACIHLAVAYLAIFGDHTTPLHQRFEVSLWNELCKLFAEKLGYESDALKNPSPGVYTYSSASGKEIFSIRATRKVAKERLQDIMDQRTEETEATSLKFSSLSESELTLWREGRPSEKLLYQLSFWYDLARWLMLRQDEGDDYTVSFQYAPNGLPNRLLVSFDDLQASFYLSEANLPLIIPGLTTVKSPLKVKDVQEESVKCITYDPAHAALIIETKAGRAVSAAPKKKKRDSTVWKLGDWNYAQGEGFWRQEDKHLLSKSNITGKEIGSILDHHLPLMKKRLEGAAIHDEPIDLSYHLSFDEMWNLHIRGYLFEEGDLSRKRSKVFESWAYLDNDGFYKLNESLFSLPVQVIPSDKVADFVTENRIWLNHIEGFRPHLTNVESDLSYKVDEDHALHFTTKVSFEDETSGSKDFGHWVYVAGEGFFSRMSRQISLPLRAGTIVQEAQIPMFIRMYHDELQLVPGFFSVICPVIKSQIRIHLDETGAIAITPSFELLPQYQDKPLHFFGEYVYMPGEGFHEVPFDSRLPERYRQSVHVELGDVPSFINFDLPLLQPYVGNVDPQLVPPRRLRLIVNSLVESALQGRILYVVTMHYQSEKGVVPVATVWQAINDKERFLKHPVGLLDLNSPRFEWLRALDPDRMDAQTNTLTLSAMELIRLHALNDLEATEAQGEVANNTRERLHQLMTFETVEAPAIDGLKSSLRPYQVAGVRWLWFLHQHQLSGLLCDDMGLGKTHQAMAMMAAISHVHKGEGSERPRFLVICPTSVLYHWQEKLQQFLPHLDVYTFYGADRDVKVFETHGDILLTSYGIWRREHASLKTLSFDLAIFDEIQIAKNHLSRLHASLREVPAAMRLGLTGTPIENHLRELKALFDLVLPAYMPSETQFREFFLKPIERDQNDQRRAILKRFIHPFVLRRKKEEVLPDLPEKTEEIVHSGLSNEQQTLYRDTLLMGRKHLLEQLQDATNDIPYMHIFALLSKLKQICNHPAVFLKRPDAYAKHSSGKWDLFVELLNEARASGQKVVVFTQYLAMLDIFQHYLKDNDIGFASIRGATQDRGEQLRRFNTQPDCEVFLGSLQAVGLGVDLTAASVVIHYDRWWNAARENQATDRVHRIGQTRGVQVFKLVTKGTFEERIDQLITRKGQLMEDVVGVDDQDAIKRFDRNELIQLLQDIDAGALVDQSGENDPE